MEEGMKPDPVVKVKGSYGSFEVSVDGMKLPNVQDVSISLSAGEFPVVGIRLVALEFDIELEEPFVFKIVEYTSNI